MNPNLVLPLVILLTSVVPLIAPVETERVGAADIESVSLLLDFGNGTVNTYEGLYGTTVLNVTESVVDVEIRWYGDLAFVTSIAGVGNNPDLGLWWQYWVNGDLGSVAANQYSLQDGDTVEWRFGPTETVTTTSTMPEGIDASLLFGLPIVGLVAVAFLIGLRVSSRK
ncbi:DUF4430 domain-containing protein [Candidatus Thorarchaeota archaeon]|nr:MAG: DUF4430 domain-containing protein [Candidatus Thorarchaeota archaeon]